MILIERDTPFPAPPARVFGVASPPASWANSLSLHKGWPEPPPLTIDVGSTFVEGVMLVTIPLQMTWAITGYDAPGRFAMSGKASLGVKVDIRFDIVAEGTGSLVSIRCEIGGALLVGSLRTIAQRWADSQIEASVTALLALVNGESVHGSPDGGPDV